MSYISRVWAGLNKFIVINVEATQVSDRIMFFSSIIAYLFYFTVCFIARLN